MLDHSPQLLQVHPRQLLNRLFLVDPRTVIPLQTQPPSRYISTYSHQILPLTFLVKTPPTRFPRSFPPTSFFQYLVELPKVVEAHLFLRHRPQLLPDLLLPLVSQQPIPDPLPRRSSHLLLYPLDHLSLIPRPSNVQHHRIQASEPPYRPAHVYSFTDL